MSPYRKKHYLSPQGERHDPGAAGGKIELFRQGRFKVGARGFRAGHRGAERYRRSFRRYGGLSHIRKTPRAARSGA